MPKKGASKGKAITTKGKKKKSSKVQPTPIDIGEIEKVEIVASEEIDTIALKESSILENQVKNEEKSVKKQADVNQTVQNQEENTTTIEESQKQTLEEKEEKPSIEEEEIDEYGRLVPKRKRKRELERKKRRFSSRSPGGTKTSIESKEDNKEDKSKSPGRSISCDRSRSSSRSYSRSRSRSRSRNRSSYSRSRSRSLDRYDQRFSSKGLARGGSSRGRNQSQSDRGEKRICYAFRDGHCKYGNNCRFSHSNTTEKQICRHFQNFGKCKFENDCKYAHTKPGAVPPVVPPIISTVSTATTPWKNLTGHGIVTPVTGSARVPLPSQQQLMHQQRKQLVTHPIPPIQYHQTTSQQPTQVLEQKQQSTSIPCISYRNVGFCQYGNACKFSHDVQEGQSNVTTQQQTTKHSYQQGGTGNPMYPQIQSMSKSPNPSMQQSTTYNPNQSYQDPQQYFLSNNSQTNRYQQAPPHMQSSDTKIQQQYTTQTQQPYYSQNSTYMQSDTKNQQYTTQTQQPYYSQNSSFTDTKIQQQYTTQTQQPYYSQNSTYMQSDTKNQQQYLSTYSSQSQQPYYSQNSTYTTYTPYSAYSSAAPSSSRLSSK